MKKLVEGKIALVTGGGAGMGACDCWKFAEEGAKGILIVDLNVDDAEKVAKEIMAQYPECKCVAVKCNVAKEADVDHCFEVLDQEFGTLDILVNNAGVSESTPFTEYTEETYDRVMDLNVKGIFTATRAASECMIAKGSGVILSTSSMVSISGQASGLAYPTSKFAVNGLTVSLARELGPRGIRVNAVAPGITETDMMKAVPKEVMDPLVRQIPLRRLGKPEDIANAFVFLASDEAAYITGVVLSVDGMART